MTPAPVTKTPLDLTAPGLMQDRKYDPLEQFLKLHTPVVIGDRNGNGDDVFKGSNIKTIERSYERHGYDPGEDKAVYDYHNEDILDALLRTNQAIRGMWKQTWDQQHNTAEGG